MKKILFSQASLSIGVVIAASLALFASPAMASSTSAQPTSCPSVLLTQPFLSYRDSGSYMIMPGESPDSFTGTGWTLTGGASFTTTTLADGHTGSVLNLPSGSKAVSPIVCVTNGFQTARTMVRNVAGAEGVQFFFAYEGTNTWGNPQNSGQVHGQQNAWTLSDPVNVQPSNQSGAQMVQFTFIPGGKTSDFQIYNFYVDPRMW